jgi:glutaredoxin-like protein NrdH
MAEARGSVSGRNTDHQVAFYGLSTCMWCRKTRMALEEADVSFDFAYVDLLQGAEREEAVNAVRRWNPAGSYPTVIVDDEKCVVGYNPDKLRGALGL